jgi:hypothetical protein
MKMPKIPVEIAIFLIFGGVIVLTILLKVFIFKG